MAGRREKDAPASQDEDDSTPRARSGTLKGGHDAAEMGRRSAAARRARAAERAQADADAALTFRQRLGVSLSRLTQDELDAAIRRMATDDRPSALTALARMADQAFGKPAPEEEEGEAGDDIATLTRAQRSALIAMLMEEEETQRTPAGESSDPRADGDGTPPPPTPPHPPE